MCVSRWERPGAGAAEGCTGRGGPWGPVLFVGGAAGNTQVRVWEMKRAGRWSSTWRPLLEEQAVCAAF